MENKSKIKGFKALPLALLISVTLVGCKDSETVNVGDLEDPLYEKSVELSRITEEIGDASLAEKALDSAESSTDGVKSFYLYDISQNLNEDGKTIDLCFTYGSIPVGQGDDGHEHSDYRSHEDTKEVCKVFDENLDDVLINGGQDLEIPKVTIDSRSGKPVYTIDM